MKLVYTEGCTCYKLNIDGKSMEDYSDKEILDICYKIIDTTANVRELLIKLVQFYGDVGYQYTCDCCGDSIYGYTLKI